MAQEVEVTATARVCLISSMRSTGRDPRGGAGELHMIMNSVFRLAARRMGVRGLPLEPEAAPVSEKRD